MIQQAYGPLVLFSKKKDPPIFSIHDKDRNAKFEKLIEQRNTIPYPIKLNIITARCLKDKVGSGHFIVMCHIMDRIGGKKIVYDFEDSHDNIRELSENFRYFSKSKTEFINKEHREINKVTSGGGSKLVAAYKTGMNFMQHVQDH